MSESTQDPSEGVDLEGPADGGADGIAGVRDGGADGSADSGGLGVRPVAARTVAQTVGLMVAGPRVRLTVEPPGSEGGN